jgi:hypothetical protein
LFASLEGRGRNDFEKRKKQVEGIEKFGREGV